MALTNAYVQVYGQLSEFFRRIAESQAPNKFTTQHLKDLGFGSSNYRAVIPLLKALGFLNADGVPTPRYHDYRNSAQSKTVMAEALKDAYGDLFTIKSKPTNSDRELIEGKFKSSHNSSPNMAKLMASTFYSLLALADLPSADGKRKDKVEEEKEPLPSTQTPQEKHADDKAATRHLPSLHYNIQIHLPATKDVEVFNAIVKALKDHIIE